MTVYIGTDLHARQQTVAFMDTADGEVKRRELFHQKDDVPAFYRHFSGDVIVGVEASGDTGWFEELIEDCGHTLLVGDATEIRRLARRRQKNDRRDAELILDLLMHDEFPRLYRYSPQSREALRQLRFRHKLVKLRTSVLNSLHALSIGAGLSLQAKLLLTSLCLAHTLGDATRFASTRKVTAYVGLDVTEYSSAERKVYGGISKAGSRLLRYLLVEAGQTAVKNDDQLRDFYQQVVKRRGKAKAKVALARKLLVRLFIMLRDEIDYAEFPRRGNRSGEDARA
jgi:transposase